LYGFYQAGEGEGRGFIHFEIPEKVMDPFRIDSHKLIFHPERVAAWQRGELIAPVYMEVAPSGSCNHRCIFCAVDYLGYRSRFLSGPVLKRLVRDAGKAGVKAIMYAGEGEPLLHSDIAGIVAATRLAGIDVSMTTNGVLLAPELSKKILKHLSWIRVSLNAGTRENYAFVHHTTPGDFDRVLGNLEAAVLLKRRRKWAVTIGVQMLLIPENVNEVGRLGRRLRDIGVDYFSIKPYSQHPMSHKRLSKGFRYPAHLDLKARLERLETKSFKVVFRDATMERLGAPRGFGRCLGTPFWAYVDAKGDAYACSAYLGQAAYCFGNIARSGFNAVMKGERRRKVLRRIATRLDPETCREVCRLDKINGYLWELAHPGPHVNFI
jgi:cyclic pyranopterin phosphate synthase